MNDIKVDDTPVVIQMPHIGPTATVAVEYVEPMLEELRTISKAQSPMDIVVAHCMATVSVDGAKKAEDWWNKLPETAWLAMAAFMQSRRPPRPADTVIATLPLVWRL